MDDLIDEFIEETSDLLRNMEDSLLRLEEEPDNVELINSVFRAAHTIKGTSDIMNFEQIRSFTHSLEGILDKFRKGKALLNKEIISLFLASQDHINNMVSDVTNAVTDNGESQIRSETLLAEIEKLLNGGKTQSALAESQTKDQHAYTTNKETENNVQNNTSENQKVTNAAIDDLKKKDKSENRYFHIQLNYRTDALKNGIDPLAVISYLGQVSQIDNIECDFSRFPEAAKMEPAQCYLDFCLDLTTDKFSKSDLESVLDFVKDYCEIHIMEHKNNNSQKATVKNSLVDLFNYSDVIVSQNHSELIIKQDNNSNTQNESSIPNPSMQKTENSVGNKSALKKITDNSPKRVVVSNKLRINADKLDELINLVGELVIASDSSKSIVKEFGDKRLIESIDSICGLMESIRDRALQMRMVPIGDTFDRFQRVVRDVSNELGKEVVLQRNGGETELDKTIVERITDPLMHLVRNAIDHGIESPQERLEKGKPVCGEISLNAFHDSGGIVIQVSDDGRGLDTRKIYQKALKSGLIDDTYKLTDQEINRLIFEPGFSTREEVTNISGRGVGMDVVKQNIESLHGHIDISTELGKGSTITLSLPLTLAVISGFMIEIENSKYVIPLEMVQECFELTEDDHNNDGFLNIRGYALPVIRLRQLFQCNTPSTENEHVAVVNFAGQSVGLIVDSLLGEIQTVIKPLGSIFKNLKGISGSTILGDGQVVMILDIPDLLEIVINNKRSAKVLSSSGHRLEKNFNFQ